MKRNEKEGKEREIALISPKEAIALSDRSDNPSPFALVHRAVAKMRESAAQPVEYADEESAPSPEQEETFYLAEQAMALQQEQEEGESPETREQRS